MVVEQELRAWFAQHMPSPERSVPPRSFLVDPAAFGTPDAEWRTDVDLDDEDAAVDLMVAWLQHSASLRLRDEAATQGITVGELARRLGWDPETFRRRLRGEQRMTLEDMLSWVRRYGVDVLPELHRTEDWFPPRRGRPS